MRRNFDRSRLGTSSSHRAACGRAASCDTVGHRDSVSLFLTLLSPSLSLSFSLSFPPDEITQRIGLLTRESSISDCSLTNCSTNFDHRDDPTSVQSRRSNLRPISLFAPFFYMRSVHASTFLSFVVKACRSERVNRGSVTTFDYQR